jgi:hypothetical protein
MTINSLGSIPALQVPRYKANIANWVFFIHQRIIPWLAVITSGLITLRLVVFVLSPPTTTTV